MKFNEYKAYIFDMDGTLYYKRPMQMEMAVKLVCYYFFHIHKIKELFLLQEYRKLRECESITSVVGFEAEIRSRLSDKYKMSNTKVDEIIDWWMHKCPLSLIAKYRDVYLISWIQRLQEAGKKVIIYSDYPVKDKLEAIELYTDFMYWPDGKYIRTLKPNSEGLQHILAENSLVPPEVLFVGDRYEKDGICAKQAGIDFIILEKSMRKRKSQYSAWEMVEQ